MYWTLYFINNVQNFIYKYLHDVLTVLNLVYATKHNISETSTGNNISYRN